MVDVRFGCIVEVVATLGDLAMVACGYMAYGWLGPAVPKRGLWVLANMWEDTEEVERRARPGA
jgi:hypothetical protein